MCIKIGLPICAYTLYTLSPGVNLASRRTGPYPCIKASSQEGVTAVTYTHQTAIHIHLPTLSAAKLATASPSGPTGWRPMLDHLHISPLINAIHMTPILVLAREASSTINLIGATGVSVTPASQSRHDWRPMLDHPHITHPHHTYYTHTLTPSSHSNTLYTHLPTPTPSHLHILLANTSEAYRPIYICPILEPTHPLTWYRD